MADHPLKHAFEVLSNPPDHVVKAHALLNEYHDLCRSDGHGADVERHRHFQKTLEEELTMKLRRRVRYLYPMRIGGDWKWSSAHFRLDVDVRYPQYPDPPGEMNLTTLIWLKCNGFRYTLNCGYPFPPLDNIDVYLRKIINNFAEAVLGHHKTQWRQVK